MKKVLGLLAAGAVLALICAGPAWAQEAAGGPGAQTASARDTGEDRGFDYGWLGLLGLAGLAGLRRPAPTAVHRDATARRP